MTTTRKPRTSRSSSRKLKLRKETLKDLDAKGKSKKVKGGVAVPYPPNTLCLMCYSVSCLPEPIEQPTHWYRPC